MIGVYSYFHGPFPMMRYTQALSSTIQGLLVKSGRYEAYREDFRRIMHHWEQARILLVNPMDHGVADVMFAEIETYLKIIAEREGLTKNSRDLYDGRTSVVAQAPPATAEEDPYGI